MKSDRSGPYVPNTEHLHNLVNREAPAAVNAERGLLSCLMLDHTCYPAVAEIIGESAAFYRPGYSILYEEIAAQIDSGAPVDIPSLADRLRLRGMLDGLGGEDGLIGIYETEPMVTIPTAV
ncbi:MAG: hypothetical protein KTR15_12150, partial [Phycisphaeraceae bacterium]|nr:hypothetical protein [Phycisphaeraceae bacterium]